MTAPGRDPPPRRVAVFRALMLGDMLCAVPALRALRRGWPAAELHLIGLAWAEPLMRRLGLVDVFHAFPGHPALPETPPGVWALPAFLAAMQRLGFDLALQMHGSGEVTNPLVAGFDARGFGGFRGPAAWAPPAPPRSPGSGPVVPWPSQGHEIERLLALTDAFGLARQGLQLEFPVDDADRDALRAQWPGCDDGPYVCVHPGAQLPSRRWPAERFAAVADALAGRRWRPGEAPLRVVLTGTEAEASLVRAVASAMRHPAVDLAGRTTLWTLGALVDGARCVVCNDTGLSHVAAARGTPSVVVSCGADVDRWAPLDRARHRVLWSPIDCRPCGHAVCPIGHPCAQAVDVPQVLATLAALRGEGGRPPRPVARPVLLAPTPP